MIRVLHCITTMAPGGTEHYLLRHMQQTSRECLHDLVVLRSTPSPLHAQCEEYSDKWTMLGMESVFDIPRVLREFRSFVSARRPDIVNCWSYFPAALSRLTVGSVPCIWNMRQSLSGYRNEKWATALAQKLLAVSHSFPDRWVYNAASVYASHAERGLTSDHYSIIENGVNTDEFFRDEAAGARVRQALEIPETATVIIHVARSRPMKGEAILEQALSVLLSEDEEMYVILCGRESGALSRHPRVFYRSYEAEMRPWYSAADFYCHSSIHKEGYPNAIVEAMACECFPVATAVGHAPDLLDGVGMCIMPNDVDALVVALREAQKQDIDRKTIRERVLQEHSDQRAHLAYLSLYTSLLHPVADQRDLCAE